MIFTVCGLPKSGKSTFIFSEYRDASKYYVIDVKSLEDSLKDEYKDESQLYSFIYRIMDHQIRNYPEKVLIIIDDFPTARSRNRILKRFPDQDHTAIYVDTPEYFCRDHAENETEFCEIQRQSKIIRAPRIKDGYCMVCRKELNTSLQIMEVQAITKGDNDAQSTYETKRTSIRSSNTGHRAYRRI